MEWRGRWLQVGGSFERIRPWKASDCESRSGRPYGIAMLLILQVGGAVVVDGPRLACSSAFCLFYSFGLFVLVALLREANRHVYATGSMNNPHASSNTHAHYGPIVKR